MSDFGTEAEVSLTVPSSELRNVRQQIESEVGAVEVGVTDGGTASAQAAQTGGRGGRQRRRARREYRWAQERTEYLEDAVVYLEEIEDKVGEGGGLGGGGIIGELIGAGAETAGDAAIELGDTAIDIATDAASTALGNAIADAVDTSSLSVEEPSWTPLAVEDPGTVTVVVDRPGWTPLAVEDPGMVGVDAPERIPVEDPGALPVEQPTLGVERDPLPVEQPTLGVDREPLPVEREPLPVEDVGPISVEVSVTGGPGGGGGGGSGGGSTGDGREGVQFGGEDGVYLGPSGLSVGGADGFQFGELDNLPGGSRSRGRRSSQTPTGSTPREISVSVDSKSNARVDVSGLDRLRDDILDAVEDGQQETRDDLEPKIESLRSELERLKDDLTR